GGSGTVTQNADGTLTYTPNAEYNGPDSFTYTVSDGQGGESTASVNITVDPLNDDPDATNDSVTVDEDESVTIDVLANDTDADSDTLTIVSFEQGGNGSVSQNTDGTLTYTPNADYNGSDSFTYTVDDGNGGTDTATVNITVNPVNDDPVAETDTVSVDEDDSVVIDVL
ncbi:MULTISPECIES: tandem-95 repeat protein, partial [Jannaschia]|uniref:tandem-95 repeat protein n=1 Tax=Jannaschia TaxID=188905 RepID=UPI001C7CECC3